MGQENLQHIDKDTRNKMYNMTKPIKVGDMVAIKNNKVVHSKDFFSTIGVVVRVPTNDIIRQVIDEMTDQPENVISYDGYLIETEGPHTLHGLKYESININNPIASIKIMDLP